MSIDDVKDRVCDKLSRKLTKLDGRLTLSPRERLIFNTAFTTGFAACNALGCNRDPYIETSTCLDMIFDDDSPSAPTPADPDGVPTEASA